MRRNKVIAEINIVPYVDVMLVLLVIFMITAPMLTQGVVVELPNTQAKAIAENEVLPVLITVDKQGKFYLNIAKEPTNPISPENLKYEVIAARKIDPNRYVLVRGDKNAAYQEVLNAMSLLQSAGVEKVGLETSFKGNV